MTWLTGWLPLTEKEEKKPIHKLASSHMARRTFVGNLYKQVLDPNIVASMIDHFFAAPDLIPVIFNDVLEQVCG